MRIVVVSPPRSGNHWIECLLGEMYGLTLLGGAQKPAATKPKVFQAWAAAGAFPDGSIFHLHCPFRPNQFDAIETVPATVVTVVRDPYDSFVSYYYWAQRRESPDRERDARRPRQQMVGKPIGDPEVLAFLASDAGFRSHLAHGNEWLHSGRAIVVRYEDLHLEPVEALSRVAAQIAPVERVRIEAAIAACSAENMRQRSEMMAWNVRVAKVGDSKDRLNEAHLAVFRERHGDLIRSLGYEVR